MPPHDIADQVEVLDGRATPDMLADPKLQWSVGWLVDRWCRRRPWFREEAEGAANYGLAAAYRSWRSGRGTQFRTYAIDAVKHALISALKREERRSAAGRGLLSLDWVGGYSEPFSEILESDGPVAGLELEGAELVEELLAMAGEREAHILRRRFVDEDSPTLETVGQELGITRERVRQLETKGLAQIRRAMEWASLGEPLRAG